MPTQQTVYYAGDKAFVPTGEESRAPKAGEWFLGENGASLAGGDFGFTGLRFTILRPALPHEDPRQVPACKTREGQEQRCPGCGDVHPSALDCDGNPHDPTDPGSVRLAREWAAKSELGISTKEAFLLALGRYVRAQIEFAGIEVGSENYAMLLPNAARNIEHAGSALLAALDAVADARAEKALAEMEAQRRAEEMKEGERVVWRSFLHANDAERVTGEG